MNGTRLNTTCETTVSIPEDSDEPQEVIEVQILPQVYVFQSWKPSTIFVRLDFLKWGHINFPFLQNAYLYRKRVWLFSSAKQICTEKSGHT